MKYFCEKNIVIRSSESLDYPIQFVEDRITLDFPNEEFVSGNWKLEPAVPPVVRYHNTLHDFIA